MKDIDFAEYNYSFVFFELKSCVCVCGRAGGRAGECVPVVRRLPPSGTRPGTVGRGILDQARLGSPGRDGGEDVESSGSNSLFPETQYSNGSIRCRENVTPGL